MVAALAGWSPDVVRTAPEKLHVTLRFLGEVPPEVRWSLPPASAFASASGPVVSGPVPSGPVVAALGPVTATFGRGVLHVPVSGLDGLAAVVDPAPSRPFVGHLTVQRGRDVRRWAGVPVPEAAQVPWPVAEVTLVRSAGGRYEVIERVPVG